MCIHTCTYYTYTYALTRALTHHMHTLTRCERAGGHEVCTHKALCMHKALCIMIPPIPYTKKYIQIRIHIHTLTRWVRAGGHQQPQCYPPSLPYIHIHIRIHVYIHIHIHIHIYLHVSINTHPYKHQDVDLQEDVPIHIPIYIQI